jgi:arylsulfotransferase ASST
VPALGFKRRLRRGPIVSALRGCVVAVGLLAMLLAGCGRSGGPAPQAQRFRSRPDLRPPLVHVVTPAHGTAPGDIFIAPKKYVAQAGPLILDDRGHVVWFHPLDTDGVTDFRVQRYRGRPVLTWWRGRPEHGDGTGGYAIVDDTYGQIAAVEPGHGLVGDIHEFLLTPRGTALMTIFHRIEVGGRPVFEGVVQEVDVATRRVLFEWHSIDHVGLDESYTSRPRKRSVPFDYFHVNSIDVDTNGDLLVSARNTHAVYEIDRRTGRIVWRLGGERSDFAFGPGARFAWQHDARRLPDGTLSLFDNEAAPQVGHESRAIVLRLDMRAMRATLVRSFVHRPPLVSVDQGNAQRLPDGHFLVGWGHNPYVTEFDARGHVLFDLRFGRGDDSYRAYRFVWHGHPADRPALAVAGDTAYASWNGATELRRWQLLAGTPLRPVRTVRASGFETAVGLPASAGFVAVRALDGRGRVLGTSRAVKRR